ncbi:hypothetical protein OS493_011706 [Desmophyllum pertusum]|uniref:tRNA (34-2'-O)-methyltransferase regulator WDR6 n=1 Tax=Desmophyllum pertusum TaxID=174260 RepID=A0A9X0CF18_9CNID|nr:hypothetical protein OS493_011706 [Desmophyllum pertusum]
MTCGEDKLITNKSGKESGDHTTVQTLAVHDEETVNKASGRNGFEGDVSSERCDRAQESVTAWHAEENVTADSVKAVEHAKNSDTKTSSHWCCKDGVAQDCVTGGCQASESVTNTEKHLTERTKFADVNPLAANQDPFHCGQEVLNVANTKEQTAITCETPDLTDPDDQEFSAMDQSDFSCLPLVPVFLDLPAHVFDAHQSGVNAISLVKTQVPGQYLLVSGGDDSALHAAEFDLVLNDNDVTKIHVIREVSEHSAHTSSVTGVKAVMNGLVISSSVDQRLIVWEMVSTDQVSFAFLQRAVEIVDIADVQDVEVWGERDDCLVAAVCGVGLQTFYLVGHT